MARNRLAPADILDLLGRDPDDMVRATALCHPATPGYLDVRATLARNRSVPAVVLATLAADAVRVRRRVAGSDGAGPALLDQLAEDCDGHVRAGVARHSSASADVHRRLLADPCSAVREALALCSRHEDVLLTLAGA